MDLKNVKAQEDKTTELESAERTGKSPATEVQSPERTKNDSVESKLATDKPVKKKKVVVIILVCLFMALLIGAAIFYWRVAVYYQTHFFPNTSINEMDCSRLEADQVTLMLDNQIQKYRLEVTGRVDELGDTGVIGEIISEDIKLHYVGNADAVNDLLEQQNEWMWIETLFNTHFSYHLEQGIEFDEQMLKEFVTSWDAFMHGKKPQDAYISEYSEENGYEIIPETMGTQLETESAIEWICEAVEMHQTEIDLQELDCYTKAALTSEDQELIEGVEKANKWLGTVITYDWNGERVIVDKALISEWVSFDEHMPQLDEEAVAEFVTNLAKEQDTYGKTHTFTTTLGVELTLQRKSYGWKTDREGETRNLLELIYQGAVEDRTPAYAKEGKWIGKNDIGNSYVEADLTNQHLYLYWKGDLVLETDFVSGNPNSPGCLSPAGIFGITYKTTNAVLRGANYETPVSYWMPFYGNFGMHDATWRTEFGGDIYLTNGSHGCLNLPLDKAEAIYQYMSEGFPIICYYY